MALDPETMAWLAKQRPILPDDQDDDADWTKRTWDLPDTPEALRAHLVATGVTIRQFRATPVYRWHVEDKPWLRDL